ncbi:hypothetical protein NM688_g4537 [Phlebia brevispora]|uniref:Uncharacterized protein n=1 Tax=Phlebia brevispora TaxID=194682 RepID=A0ACC1T2V2_9APHY|nr:hypothetical protein NM688_g4537 [Phlebia brevispora]
MISRAFTGQHGRAYLFDVVVNVVEGEPVDRQMTTGNHTVRDIYCCKCGKTLGWKYEHAYEPSQKYKEGKYILERQLLVPIPPALAALVIVKQYQRKSPAYLASVGEHRSGVRDSQTAVSSFIGLSHPSYVTRLRVLPSHRTRIHLSYYMSQHSGLHSSAHSGRPTSPIPTQGNRPIIKVHWGQRIPQPFKLVHAVASASPTIGLVVISEPTASNISIRSIRHPWVQRHHSKRWSKNKEDLPAPELARAAIVTALGEYKRSLHMSHAYQTHIAARLTAPD